MFDLKKCEADLRANTAKFKARPLPHDADAEYVAVQNRAAEVEIQYVLWQLGEQNRGTQPAMILQGTGAMLASIACGITRIMSDKDQAMALVMETMVQCINDHQLSDPVKFENHDVAGSA